METQKLDLMEILEEHIDYSVIDEVIDRTETEDPIADTIERTERMKDKSVSDIFAESFPRLDPAIYKEKRKVRVELPDLPEFRDDNGFNYVDVSDYVDYCKTVESASQEYAVIDMRRVFQAPVDSSGPIRVADKVYAKVDLRAVIKSSNGLTLGFINPGYVKRGYDVTDDQYIKSSKKYHAVDLKLEMTITSKLPVGRLVTDVPAIPDYVIEQAVAAQKELYLIMARHEGNTSLLESPQIRVLWTPKPDSLRFFRNDENLYEMCYKDDDIFSGNVDSLKAKGVYDPDPDPVLVLRVDGRDHIVCMWDDEKEEPIHDLIERYRER